jgi:hypothetical protein
MQFIYEQPDNDLNDRNMCWCRVTIIQFNIDIFTNFINFINKLLCRRSLCILIVHIVVSSVVRRPSVSFVEVRQILTKFISLPASHARHACGRLLTLILFLELKSYVLYCYIAVSVIITLMLFLLFLRFTEQPEVRIVTC